MSDAAELRQRIVTVMSAVFSLPADVVARGISPDQVETWDSERHVELVVALEEGFDCLFDPEEVPELVSLEQIEAIVSAKQGA